MILTGQELESPKLSKINDEFKVFYFHRNNSAVRTLKNFVEISQNNEKFHNIHILAPQ